MAAETKSELKSERKKVFRTRARTGCSTCRKAHVRCDENKPQCRRCTRLGLVCGYLHTKSDGGSPLATAQDRIRPLAPAVCRQVDVFSQILAQLGGLGSVYFDFFKTVVVPQLCMQPDGPAAFWSTTLLRECLLDSCVVDAIAGIGALSRARREALGSASAQIQSGDLHMRSSTHYLPAVQHYTKAIAAFRRRIESDAAGGSVPPRKFLIFTLLFSIFEILHGNLNDLDHLISHGLRLFSGHLIASPASSCRHPVEPKALDDIEMYDAECFLIRTATWNAIFTPMCPKSREVLASMAAKSVGIEGEQLLGPAPPGREMTSVKEFWRGWWQFITQAVMWHLRVQTMLSSIKNTNPDDHKSAASTTLAQLKEEQKVLSARTALWMTETQARIDGNAHQHTFRTSARAVQRHEDEKILAMMVVDVRICYLSGYYALDFTENAWSQQSCLDECNDALDAAHDIVSTIDTYEVIWSDGLLIGLLQLAKECRDRNVRLRAFDLAKKLVLRTSTWPVKALVLGTWACIESEEEAREGYSGRIPSSHQYDWTAASWDEGHCALHVTITSRSVDATSGVRTEKHKVLATSVLGL